MSQTQGAGFQAQTLGKMSQSQGAGSQPMTQTLGGMTQTSGEGLRLGESPQEGEGRMGKEAKSC
jgi:hypothetical protein